MSFDSSNGARRRGLLPDATSVLQSLTGIAQQASPWIDDLVARISRSRHLPPTGGLIGGEHARYMADNAPVTRSVATAPVQPAPLAARPAPGAALAGPAPPRAPSGQPALGQVAGAAPKKRSAKGPVTPFLPQVANGPNPEAQQLASLMDYLGNDEVEGTRRDVYLDNKLKPTVGVGHLVTPQDHLRLHQEISDAQVKAFLRADAGKALRAAQQQAAEAGIADPNFIVSLGSVNYQLGPAWRDKFTKTWPLIVAGRYDEAAEEAARSKWLHDSPKRVAQFQAALRRLPPRGR